MNAYVNASVLLRVALAQPNPLPEWPRANLLINRVRDSAFAPTTLIQHWNPEARK